MIKDVRYDNSFCTRLPLYYIICKFVCMNIISARYFAYSTHCIEAIVRSIRYFKCQKYRIGFFVG